MILCIPTEGDKGFDELVATNIRSAPTFTLFDSSTNKTRIVAMNRARKGESAEAKDQFPREEMDAVVVRDMEEKAIEKLRKRGIVVYVGATGTVSETIINWGQGRLGRYL